MTVLVIDNYDSFTYNLVQYLGELSQAFAIAANIHVVRNDAIDLAAVRTLAPDGILISPGPGRPEDAGISLDLIRELGPTMPILGVCLGHQSLGQVFGGQVVAAPELMHGKTSPVVHTGQGVFRGLASPLTATRYHSLVVDRPTCPEVLEITAWVDDGPGSSPGTIMGLRHRHYPHLEGVQFHPESILTQEGKRLLANWLASLPPIAPHP